ncbi:hypothetical protein [Desulfomarina profundi]|uniref:hypothetical protein n=1 Tax=Desulfomarina profundi TaxID=2772557 RepID=UPI001E38525C|nr:hypothetical protein [Desulfomarina profundi]
MISHFLILLAIAFSLVLTTALIISFCKRRQNRTRHGLTGMCHQSGGTMCESCDSQLRNKPLPKNSPPSL